MTTTVPAVSTEQHEAGCAWLKKFFETGDSLDYDAWVTGFFAPDARLAFNANPAVAGHAAILARLKGSGAALHSMRHRINRIDVLPDAILADCTTEYVVRADPERRVLALPAFVRATKTPAAGVLSAFQVWGDLTALTQRVAEVQAKAE